jgi:superfamily II DNA or RNA helicase
MNMREYQKRILHSANELMAAGEKRIVIKAPTGAGKTVMAASLVLDQLERRQRAAFVVPSISLIDQTVNSFWNLGIRGIGVMQANHEMTNTSLPVQICSKDTLSRRKIYPTADLVLVDECHVQSEFLFEWMRDKPDLPFIGLSATPWTKGLGQKYDKLINHVSTQSLIDQGFLSPFEVWSPSAPDLTKIKTVAGDYDLKQLSKRSRQPKLIADIVETWLRLGNNEPTICFAVDRLHAQAIRDAFQNANVAVEYCDAFTPREERAEIKRRLEAGDIRVVCNVGVLTTGVDWDIRCIILARSTKSEMLFCQIIGRGLRTAPGKEHLIILDHSDNTHRLGFVTDIDYDELDDGISEKQENKRKPREPKSCPVCHFTKPIGAFECPKCGHKPVLISKIRAEDGSLQKQTSGAVKNLEAEQWYSELLGYARKRGFKDGWAWHKVEGKFGVRLRSTRHLKPQEPSQKVLNWIQYEQIRYAKGRRRA